MSCVAVIAPARAQDPFDTQPSDKAAEVANAAAAVVGCLHITSALCQKQNQQLGMVAAGYVIGCVLLTSLWRGWWNRRGTSSATVRLMLPMLTGAAAAGALVALDPARGADLECCLASNVLRAEILLQDSTIARALLLGALPAIVLYLLVAFATGLSKA
jgi:hypothetical protein